jgi:hypothetical protein
VGSLHFGGERIIVGSSTLVGSSRSLVSALYFVDRPWWGHDILAISL